MESFASGWKRNYYGKGDVTVYRLNRDGQAPEGETAVFGANVKMLLYGDSFWPTYTTGDNTGLIATDSMKNFIQCETMNFQGHDLEAYVKFLAEKFIALYPQAEGIQLTARQIPHTARGTWTFAPSGPEQTTASIEINRQGVVSATSGIHGFRLLRLGGSAFKGFVRDEYTTLPDITNRPLHMWLDLDWHYNDPSAALTNGQCSRHIARITHEIFDAFESGSIQQVIYQLGTRVLAEIATVSEIHLEANNRTWDTIAEQGDILGAYTDARPPYGVLGLSMRR